MERCLPAGTPPLPTSSPHSALSRAVSLSISPSRSRPSSRPARSPALRFHPPIPTSPTSSFIPLPSLLLPAPACPTPGKPLPSGSAALKAGSLAGGGSGWSAAALLVRGRRARLSDRDRSAPATARITLPPALRTAAALRVSARDPPPPHPARLCRLLQRASLPSGRRCCCRRRHRAKFRPRPPSAVQGSSASAPGPRLPASPGPGTMSEKSVEAAAELSAKVRAGAAAARNPGGPGIGAVVRARSPPTAPSGPGAGSPRTPLRPPPRSEPGAAYPARRLRAPSSGPARVGSGLAARPRHPHPSRAPPRPPRPGPPSRR